MSKKNVLVLLIIGCFSIFILTGCGEEGGIQPAALDYDDTAAYGPEIITIYKLTPGTYYYSVHNFSNQWSDTSTSLSESTANVTITQGTKTYRYSVSPGNIGTYWDVCKIVIDNSKNVTVTPVNTYRT